MLLSVTVIHIITILVLPCCYSNAIDDKVTAMVEIGNQSYSTLKRPEKDSAIVKGVMEINIQLGNVENVLQQFPHVGVFIRVAQLGLKLYPMLQAQLTRFAISVVELNDEAGLMVSRFASVSDTVLRQFEFALWYVYHNQSLQAVEELKLVSNSAVKMIEQASNIRDKVVKKRDEVMDFVDRVANESIKLQEARERLKNETRAFEAAVKQAESLMKEAEQEEKRYYSLYKETCEQEYDAYRDLFKTSILNGFLKVATTLFTGRISAGKDPINVSPMEGYMGSLSQKAMFYLEKVEHYVEQKHRAIESYVQNNYHAGAKASDIQINEETYDALIGAQQSLQLIAFVMNDVVFFWSSMHNYLQFFLIENQENFNSFIALIRNNDMEQLWNSQPFKEQVVIFYSHWVALLNVCQQSMKEFMKTRNEMREDMLMDEESILAKYETLRKNPRLIEHQKN